MNNNHITIIGWEKMDREKEAPKGMAGFYSETENKKLAEKIFNVLKTERLYALIRITDYSHAPVKHLKIHIEHKKKGVVCIKE